MKKILSLALLLMACFVITSCSNDEEVITQSSVARDYQTDAQVLAKFVDINKTIGEYYINENKKNSPMSYITNKDLEELQLVNPVNRVRYENDLKVLNSQLEAAAKRSDVSQIVYSVQGETWIRNIDNNDVPFSLEQTKDQFTRASRASWRLQLAYNSEQRTSFYAGRQITSNVSINMTGYNYYYFEVICDTNASKSPSGSVGGSNPKSILLSGTAIMENYTFRWTANSSDTQIYWEFRGRQNAPNFSGGTIMIEFSDY